MPDNALQIVTPSNKQKGIDVTKVAADFRRAYSHKKKWLDEAKKDFEFALGKQWDEEDVRALEQQGVKALTINKIQASLFMLSGLQRQNRSDYIAFPEGEEDSVVSEIATKLLKNLMKRAAGESIVSEVFEDGSICGEGWLEPFLDFEEDFVNGQVKLKKASSFDIFPDPSAKEYDVSDGRFCFKWTRDLLKEQLIELFPDHESQIENIADGKISVASLGALDGGDAHIQARGYNDHFPDNATDLDDMEEQKFDLVEYYYKKNAIKYFVIDTQTGRVLEEKDAERANVKRAMLVLEGSPIEAIKIIKKSVPEIWLARMIGLNHVITNEVSWSYPRFRSFPFIPLKGHYIQVAMGKDQDLTVQGIVRSMRDPQIEVNKRRTQEMRHLNQSANSGWIVEEGALVNESVLYKFGASPGVVIKTKQGRQGPVKITPTPLSQGHAQLAAENAQDMKEISGINADLLAQFKDNESGKALRIKEQRSLVMVQRLMDNLSRTKKLLGKFLLSMLGEVYGLQEVKKVLGQSFIEENFTSVEPPQLTIDGQTIPGREFINEELLDAEIARVLEDTSLGKFDVAVGEGQLSETTKITNFLILQELAQAGLPIPPEILIEESIISSASKEKIKAAIQNAAQQQVQGAA